MHHVKSRFFGFSVSNQFKRAHSKSGCYFLHLLVFFVTSSAGAAVRNLEYFYDTERTAGLVAKVTTNGQSSNIRTEFSGAFAPEYALDEVSQNTRDYLKSRTHVRVEGDTGIVVIELQMDDSDQEDTQKLELGRWKPEGETLIPIAPPRSFNSTMLRLITQDPSTRDQLLQQIQKVNLSLVEKYPIRMDLHTHFGGAMTSETILTIAEKNRIPYPKRLLKKMGLEDRIISDPNRFPLADDRGNVLLHKNTMGAALYSKINSALAISMFKVVTFDQLEAIYELRGPFVKHLPSFPDYLRALADEYQKAGVKYVEIAISDIAKTEYIESAHQVLDQIEEATGVHIAFKASLWRHNPPDYNFRFMRAVEEINSPRVIGVDFMGEETNATAVLKELIEKAAEIKKKRPHFQIQVHAGESKFWKHNILQALQYGATQIGHGLNGVEVAVLDLAQQMVRDKLDLIIETNAGSNVALNNARQPLDVLKAIRHFIHRDIPVTISSDGHGLFRTQAMQEAFSAWVLLDLDEEDFRKITFWQEQYISKMMEAYRVESEQFKKAGLNQIPSIDWTSADTKQWDLDVLGKRKRLEQNAREANPNVILLNSFDPNQSPLGDAGAGRKPVFISLPGGSSWLRCEVDHDQKIRGMVHQFVNQLDPQKVYLITSGNRCGAEAYIYEAAEHLSIPIVALASLQTAEGVVDAKNNYFGVVGSNWKKRNSDVLKHIVAMEGAIIFMDGGKKTPDLLKSASFEKDEGKNFKFLLYSGVQESLSLHEHLRDFSNQPTILFRTVDELTRSIGDLTKRVVEPNTHLTVDPSPVRELPLYCKLPKVYQFAFARYGDNLGTHSEALVVDTEILSNPNTTAEAREILAFLSKPSKINEPYADYETPLTVSNLRTEYSYLDETGNPVGLRHLDPQNIRRYFYGLNDAQILSHLKRRVEEGMHPEQTLAKICIALHNLGLKNPDGSAFNLPVPPVTKGSRDLKIEKELSKTRALSSFLTLEEARAVPSSPDSSQQRLLIVTRGISHYNQMASELKRQFANVGLDAYLVGTDRNIAEVTVANLKDPNAKEFKWPEIRGRFLKMNQEMLLGTNGTPGLLAKHVPVVVYADMNKKKEFLDDITQEALKHDYQVIIVKPEVARATYGKAHLVKADQDLNKPEQEFYSEKVNITLWKTKPVTNEKGEVITPGVTDRVVSVPQASEIEFKATLTGVQSLDPIERKQDAISSIQKLTGSKLYKF